MSDYLRPRVPGATVFFTVALAARGSDLLLRELPRLRAAVAGVRRARPFAIDAFVVLPDHLHAIWTLPEGDADYGVRWSAIKAAFSRGIEPGPRRASHLSRREKGIWQRRFWEHHIRNDDDFGLHLRHCWMDPVRHGLVARPEDWTPSSIHRDQRRHHHPASHRPAA